MHSVSISIGMVIAGFLGALGIGALGHRLGWLTLDGAIAAAVVGGCIFGFAGWQGAVVLLLFFVSSSLLSRLNREEAHGADSQPKKSQPRNARQVLANGAVAALAAVWLAIVEAQTRALGWEASGALAAPGWLAGVFGAAGALGVWPKVALAGALAAATADTWATEIGRWAKGIPRSALTARIVEPGESGGMTAYGTFAGLVGAAMIGTAAAWVWEDLGISHAMAIEVAGFAGMWFDSLLGAGVQYKAYCAACGRTIEDPKHKHPVQRPRGWRFVDNDVVNFAATLAGAVMALLGLRSF